MSLIGQTLGNYRVDRLLGSGGMSAVYLAEDLVRHRRVALKLLLPSLAADMQLVSRFVGEARVASEIQHPHIVDVLDTGQSTDAATGETSFYYAMEYLSGETLTQRLATRPPSVEAALRIARQCCSALAASHARGIIHRDLKPGNIFLVEKDGQPDFVKLMDFGIARLLNPALNPAAAHRTRTGMMLGTPAYMSPEQTATRGVVDARSDVYSLGVVLYLLLAGRLPFAHKELVELVRAHRTQVPAAPSVHRPGLPPALDAIVLRALEKNPQDRFQSMSDLEAALAGEGAAHAERDSAKTLAPDVLARSTAITASRPAVSPAAVNDPDPTVIVTPDPAQRAVARAAGEAPTIIVPPDEEQLAAARRMEDLPTEIVPPDPTAPPADGSEGLWTVRGTPDVTHLDPPPTVEDMPTILGVIDPNLLGPPPKEPGQS